MQVMKGNPQTRRSDPEAAVLIAYFAAREAGRPSVDCYKAGIDVWKCLHPDHAPTYAARCAVRVILDEIQEHMMDVTAIPEGGPSPAI